MLGPQPYKTPAPFSSDTTAPKPSLDGVQVPDDLNVAGDEFLSLAEAPDVEVPSTYDDALRNDELLDRPDLLDPTAIEIFPTVATKDEVAFGIPSPASLDTSAFGGGIGLSAAPGATKITSTVLTTDEKAVILQNSVVVGNALIGITGGTAVLPSEHDLGSKLTSSVSSARNLTAILSVQATFPSIDTEIIRVEQLNAPTPPDIVDGGEF